MARCPNCNYLLVLLPKRNKYKCAKCSKLWRELFIDNREFRNWNGLQRDLTKDSVEKEIKQKKHKVRIETKKKRVKLTEEQKRQRWRGYYSKNREKILTKNREWRQNNLEYDKKLRKDYYQRNKVMIKVKVKLYQLKNKDKEAQRKYNYRLQKLEHFKAKDKERYCKNRDKIRQQQNTRYKLKKALALMGLENKEEKPSRLKIHIPNAHYLLSDQLDL